MKRKTGMIAVLSMTIAACWISAALAADPSGWWRSSTGSRIKISASLDGLTVSVHSQSGTVKTFNGHWTQMPQKFEYYVPNDGTRVVMVDSNNPNLLHVYGGKNNVTWSREHGSRPHNGNSPPPSYNQNYNQGQPQPQRHNRSASIDGVWGSTTGNTFQITTKGNQVFITIIKDNGQRLQGSGRWLNYGSSFDYSLPGYPGVAQCYVASGNPNRIKVVKDGRETWWDRIR